MSNLLQMLLLWSLLHMVVLFSLKILQPLVDHLFVLDFYKTFKYFLFILQLQKIGPNLFIRYLTTIFPNIIIYSEFNHFVTISIANISIEVLIKSIQNHTTFTLKILVFKLIAMIPSSIKHNLFYDFYIHYPCVLFHCRKKTPLKDEYLERIGESFKLIRLILSIYLHLLYHIIFFFHRLNS